MSNKPLPLVYSCSGCSSAAQLSNHLALRLDRMELAEMSCIAGVGGDVPALVKTAKSGRPMLVLDGCPMECAKNCLKRHGIVPDEHVQLHDDGVIKRQHQGSGPEQAEQTRQEVAGLAQKSASPAGTSQAAARRRRKQSRRRSRKPPRPSAPTHRRTSVLAPRRRTGP